MNQMVAVPSETHVELPVGTQLLNGQYQLLNHLQQGGFGITYVARDSLDRQVVIKECFPAGYCKREGNEVHANSEQADKQFQSLKRQFLREARRMAKLRHPHIVAIHQVFEENNSAYMALDYVEGTDLITVLEENPERLSPRFLESALMQTLEAVQYIHSHGLLHRDIAPDNIRVNDQDQITLIDFGAAREHQPTGGAPMVTTLVAVKDGYSPHEFYLASNMHDFSSDLYSLGATFYHLITGIVPPNCQQRLSAVSSGMTDPYVPLADGDWDIGYNLLATIDRSLEVLRENRFLNTKQWVKALEETPKVRPARPKPVVFDTKLDAAVSMLVQETNMTLPSKAARQMAAPAPEARQEVEYEDASDLPSKQWVDILGNPIDDLSAWHDEQNDDLRADEHWGNMHDRHHDSAARGKGRAGYEGKSVIVGLLMRCLARNPASRAA
ncbi:serine/threonine protein kinase [Sinirhodobacter sp. WL0062]|uniref:Serine/threonine protein kinase n=1 Tax=Rhodobacter flavimaris TaxID=2907145 RepID=A0ABS8Z595_9RHOB|nr:serine/threonine-protein kinase [Sinirhodobacter sp. WL0062]MCE5975110.1 serine/threonine protein kinase [Sinirhodobacter sp. WL0062]